MLLANGKAKNAPYVPPFELSSGRDNITGWMGRIYQKLTAYVELTIARKGVSRQFKERSSYRDETKWRQITVSPGRSQESRTQSSTGSKLCMYSRTTGNYSRFRSANICAFITVGYAVIRQFSIQFFPLCLHITKAPKTRSQKVSIRASTIQIPWKRQSLKPLILLRPQTLRMWAWTLTQFPH